MHVMLEDELKKYGKLCNDELGTYIQFLCALNSYTWCMNKDFKKAYESEFAVQLEYFRKNSEIVTTRIINEYDIEELAWKENE